MKALEIIMLIVSVLVIFALIVTSFVFGYIQGTKKKNDDNVLNLTEENADAVKGFLEWLNYRG